MGKQFDPNELNEELTDWLMFGLQQLTEGIFNDEGDDIEALLQDTLSYPDALWLGD